MPAGNPHTSVRSRTVAAELRALREQRNLSCEDVAEVLGVSASKVSRMETGKSGLQYEDVAALLGFYRVPMSKRHELLDRLKRSDERGWWERQAGLPQLWRALIEFEAKAARIHDYQSLVVPGLLQTGEYCRALIEGLDKTLSDGELDNLVAARMARQTLLTRANAMQYLAVISEDALRQDIGAPGVMLRQIRHLLSAAERPNITVRVVPRGIGVHVGLRGPFIILEFADEPHLVHLENQDTAMFLDEEPDLSAYRVAFRNILGVSLAPAATAERLAMIAEELTGRTAP
ncbi:helix-turn-helix domain-containing protein [Solihabitans fulvus]|uniref:Helix-turn-helix domain-containing protein n=1 Tax=Solihabitans fulvus TaxID=1892852 RepID=A0A5B2WMX7_9PSEU|nr:helix-turn-helix transcriptional regulator [Solihabitans fulvus]KAA2252130.1 helix-turn-helix domain-containing protein [Solihabitans fulvus]